MLQNLRVGHGLKIVIQSQEAKLPDVTMNAFFDSRSYLGVALPGETESVKEPPEGLSSINNTTAIRIEIDILLP
jgi:hypothetical protein